jgi:hypothetical protein
MFTVPDQNDAVATCPPLSPVGPNPGGFFADCNPGQNFPGTRPIAEHFNELILNLHALLAKSSVAPVKGDPTMLWRAILNLPIIRTAVTLNVSTSGSATPANPWGGDPFNTVQNAIAFLDPYAIVVPGSVTIQIAAGTYPSTSPITVENPYAYNIRLIGAGPGATILQFTDCVGLQCLEANLGKVSNVTIRGGGTGSTKPQGLYVHGGVIELDNITVEQFRGTGIWIDRGTVVITNVVTANDNGQDGFFIGGSSIGYNGPIGGTMVANRNAGDSNVGFSATQGVVHAIQTTGGNRGIWLNVSAGVYIEQLSVGAVAIASDAVLVTANSSLLSPSNPVANSWSVAAGQSFHADMMGLIYGTTCLATANRPQTSPAINTLGNIDSYIQAS